MKWRKELNEIATKVLVDAPSETAYFCSFESLADFVKGYWIFLSRSPYEGWEEHAEDAEDFIDFIGPIWAADPAYTEKLKDLLAEADKLILETAVNEDVDEDDAPCCEGMSGAEHNHLIEWEKPSVKWDPSPFIFREVAQISTLL